jgi:hypothetical protein
MEQLDYSVAGCIHPPSFSSSVRLPCFWLVTQMPDPDAGVHHLRASLLALLDCLGAD